MVTMLRKETNRSKWKGQVQAVDKVQQDRKWRSLANDFFFGKPTEFPLAERPHSIVHRLAIQRSPESRKDQPKESVEYSVSHLQSNAWGLCSASWTSPDSLRLNVQASRNSEDDRRSFSATGFVQAAIASFHLQQSHRLRLNGTMLGWQNDLELQQTKRKQINFACGPQFGSKRTKLSMTFETDTQHKSFCVMRFNTGRNIEGEHNNKRGLLLMDPRISGSSQSLKMPAHLKFRQKRLQAPEGAKLRSKKVTKHKPLGKFELGKADQVQSRLDSDTPVKELHFSGQKSLEDGNSRRILHSSLGLASWLPMSKDTNFKTRLDFSLPLPVGVQMNGFAHFPGVNKEGDQIQLSKRLMNGSLLNFKAKKQGYRLQNLTLALSKNKQGSKWLTSAQLDFLGRLTLVSQYGENVQNMHHVKSGLVESNRWKLSFRFPKPALSIPSCRCQFSKAL